MRCFMRQVSWRSGKGYKQVDIMPIPTEGIHRGARGKRRHASSLVQQRLNGKHSRRYLVQLVNANFGAGDWLLTLTYAPEYLPASFEEACRRMEKFIDRLRAACKRAGPPEERYHRRIWVTEGGTEEAEAAGEAKRYHHHAFLSCALDARAITELWCTGRGKHRRPLGRVHLSLAQPEQGSLEAWADYCIKTKHCRRKWRQSIGLKKPVVTVNDSKYTRRAIERAVRTGEAYRPAFWEKAHPGWQCKSIRVEYNEYQRGYYVRLEFWRECDPFQRPTLHAEYQCCHRIQDSLHFRSFRPVSGILLLLQRFLHHRRR